VTKALTYSIGADLSALARAMDGGVAQTRKFKKELAELEAQQRQHRAAITDLGQGVFTFGAAVTAGLGLATKAAIDWESAFTGVRKTVDGSDAEIASLEKELRGLAKTLPATHEEIAGVAEAAGQLGIKRQDIAAFTKVMVDLGNTTNLTAEEAATDLAKFSNIMGTSASQVDHLGATLVALGNDGASTEKDIISMGLRIAGAGHQVGLTEDQVLSFASALSSVGIEAEAGGSSFSTVMIKMAVAAKEGGEAVESFARVANMSAEQFTELFQRDAAGAIVAFINGLNRMQTTGQNVFGVLDDLGLSEIRVRDALLRSAGASDMLNHSLEVGKRGWIENTALLDEANKRYATTEARLQVVGNQIKDSLIDVGASMGPILAGGAQGVADIVRAYSELPGPLKEVVTFTGLAAAGIALVGGAALIAYPKVLAFRESMRELNATGGAMGGALGKFGLFMSGPWGAAIGVGITLLGAFAAGSGAASRRQQELAEAGRSVAEALREQGGALNDSVRKTAAKAAAEKGLLDQAEKLGISLPEVTDAILQQGNAYGDLHARLETLSSGSNRSREDMKKDMHEQVAAAKELKTGIEDLVNGKNKELQTSKAAAEATKQSSTAARENADAMAEQERQTKEATEALEEMVKALDSMNNITLSSNAAYRKYLDQLDETHAASAKVTDAQRKSGEALDLYTKAGRANRQTLDDQAKAANDLAEAAAREAESTGGAAAGIAAMKGVLENARPALEAQARAFGMNEKQARDYVNAVLAIPTSPIFTPVGVTGIPTAQAEINQFIRNNDGRVIGITVRTNTGPGVQTLVNGRPVGQVRQAGGGFVSFAGGGMYEDHRPQIVRAQPGTVRIWAEPETVREAYIPYAMDRRGGATTVLRQVAQDFGYALAPRSQAVRYAGGGWHGGGSPAGGTWRVELAPTSGAESLFVRWMRTFVKDVGGGNVQKTFGS
jgi:TP901 family phage tail tape measure protein